MLQPEYCRARQRRLLEVMQRERYDAVIVGHPHHVYYLSGHRPFWQHQAAVVLLSDGRSTLVAANQAPPDVAADEVLVHEASYMGTNRQEQAGVVAALVKDRLGGAERSRVAYDDSGVSAVLALLHKDLTDWTNVNADLWQLRRRKDPDELALMKVAVACTEAMYARAREIIAPGVAELTVYAELHGAAVAIAGEPLSAYLGNDYACGVPGGPPRKDRVARAGELYILDLGPAYRGYFADNSRAFVVDGKPTDAQARAWETVVGTFPIVERMARPGVRCRDIFAAVDAHYREATGDPFPHHLGHGVGLQPHEFPHLNPNWDDTLLEGEVFTVEPGLYGAHLGGGMRIENQYLVGPEGVTNLTPFPTGLV